MTDIVVQDSSSVVSHFFSTHREDRNLLSTRFVIQDELFVGRNTSWSYNHMLEQENQAYSESSHPDGFQGTYKWPHTLPLLWKYTTIGLSHTSAQTNKLVLGVREDLSALWDKNKVDPACQ